MIEFSDGVPMPIVNKTILAAELLILRKAEENLPDINFFHPKSPSELIDTEINIS